MGPGWAGGNAGVETTGFPRGTGLVIRVSELWVETGREENVTCQSCTHACILLS